MSDNKNLTHNRKKDLLSKEVEHIDITSFDAMKIISSMDKFMVNEKSNNNIGARSKLNFIFIFFLRIRIYLILILL